MPAEALPQNVIEEELKAKSVEMSCVEYGTHSNNILVAHVQTKGVVKNSRYLDP